MDKEISNFINFEYKEDSSFKFENILRNFNQYEEEEIEEWESFSSSSNDEDSITSIKKL